MGGCDFTTINPMKNCLLIMMLVHYRLKRRCYYLACLVVCTMFFSSVEVKNVC